MVKKVRPHKIFQKVENSERMYLNLLPGNNWVMTILEISILVSLLKIIKPQKVFEFGTYRGETTQILAANMPVDSRLITLDLATTKGVSLKEKDKRLAEEAISSDKAFKGKEYEKRITQILCDSAYFDPSPYAGQFQYIFIDGNHKADYVKIDTENSLKMLDLNNPSCMIWHDYGNPYHDDLTQYIDELSNNMPLYHVEETLIVVYLKGLKL